ncbi:dihydrolipoyl dehydrogenase [Kiloniella litopenaei]|uniref:dihydrolipoyl dehydrogenase n=1 Tax=Kiloniella litopenaei TaxID=1549748 RepID=UPI003BA8C0F6
MARTYHEFDLIIIGAGTAGLSALKEAKKYTDNVLLIHDGSIGTTCARVGCMPSKSLIHAAKLYDTHKKMPDAGIVGSELIKPDLPKILKSVREKRDHFVSYIKEEMESLQDYMVQGTARYETPTTIRADGRLFHTKSSVIATGSSPFIPKKYEEFESQLITSDTLFERRDLPNRLAVVGMGAIGLEMAQAFAMLGVDVTAINRSKKVGVVSDAKINNTIIEALAEDMKIWLNTDPDVKQTPEGLLLRTKTQEATVDAIFVAAGRKPSLSKLGLKRLGLNTNGNGVPSFNRYSMQVQGYPIYIAGDATDERAVLHEAVNEGERAAYNALHSGNKHAPHHGGLQIIFTKPVTAVVGDTEYAMRHDDIVIGEADFEDQGRAKIEGENFGKIRLFADRNGGYLRGAEIMAPAAEHLAHFLSLGLVQHLTLKQILKTPFYHPSLEEGLKSALENALEKIEEG